MVALEQTGLKIVKTEKKEENVKKNDKWISLR